VLVVVTVPVLVVVIMVMVVVVVAHPGLLPCVTRRSPAAEDNGARRGR
jgi:hypothetical protein